MKIGNHVFEESIMVFSIELVCKWSKTNSTFFICCLGYLDIPYQTILKHM